METLLAHIATSLLARKQTVATAESCTGGLLGAALTRLPGSSAWYSGGIVAYSNALKTRLLDVPVEVLAAHGAVSSAAARAMAEGARRKCQVDYAISVTGIAGPDGGTPAKPVGLVHMAVASHSGTAVFEHLFPGSRAEIRAAAVGAALRHLLESLIPASETGR